MQFRDNYGVADTHIGDDIYILAKTFLPGFGITRTNAKQLGIAMNEYSKLCNSLSKKLNDKVTSQLVTGQILGVHGREWKRKR